MKLKSLWQLRTLIIFAIIMTLLSGCSKVCHISEEECQRESKPKIVGLITTSGQEIKIDGGYYELSSRSFMGMDEDGNPILIKSDSVANVEVKELDMFTTTVVVASVLSAIAVAEIIFIRAAIDKSLSW